MNTLGSLLAEEGSGSDRQRFAAPPVDVGQLRKVRVKPDGTWDD